MQRSMMVHAMARMAAVVLLTSILTAHAQAPVMRIMPVGDSITDGTSFSSPGNGGPGGGYRLPLWQALTNAGYNIDYIGSLTVNPAVAAPMPTHHEGHSGWRIDQIHAIIESVFGANEDPDALLMMIGTNDFGQDYDENNATNRLIALIGRVVTNKPHCKVIVASLTQRSGANGLAIQTNFNNSLPGIVSNFQASGAQVYYTDMWSAVPLADMPDGLHPSTNGYVKMATNWFPAITNLLGPYGSTNAPVILRSEGAYGGSNVTIRFSKPVGDSATNALNYIVTEGLGVLGAVIDPATRRSVSLTTDPQIPLAMYTVIVTGITDMTAAQTEIAPTATVFQAAASIQSGATNNVPEATNYIRVLSLSIPDKPNFTSSVTYDVDNRASVQYFSRVAYYLELQTNGGPFNYVWVSFDAVTGNRDQIGVPTFSSGAVFQQPVTNMNVLSSLASIINGTNLSGGNIEFWPHNYDAVNSAGVPNASGSLYDWGDNRSTSGNHGSMQVHNHAANQVIFGFSHWNAGQAADLGMGNQPSGNPDWTFSNSSTNYTVKKLEVFVLPLPDTFPPQLTNAEATVDRAGVTLSFSEGVADNATNVAYYTLSGGATVLSAAFAGTNRNRIVLGTTLLDYNQTYTATVNNVSDTNGNVIATNSTAAFRSPAQNGVYLNVPEAADWTMVYSLNLPNSAAYNTSAIPYEVDYHWGIVSFSRIAYYMELQTNGGAPRFVWVEMDPFTGDAGKIGVPAKGTGAMFQQNVTNMTVRSSELGIVEGTGIQTGNIEFWPWDYSSSNAVLVPNASHTAFDWGDRVTTNSGGYASMQIHNWGANLGASTGQVLFAFNRWGSGGGNANIGIGSAPTGNVDYTFNYNAATYTVKKLQVFVLPEPDATPPALVSAAVSLDRRHVVVTFSEAVTDASAALANFALDGGLVISAATLSSNLHDVVLTVGAVDGGTYTLTVNNVRDRSPAANQIAPGSTVSVTFDPLPAQILGNVAEAADYKLLYYLDIPATSPGWNYTGTTYNIDNRHIVPPFARVAYFMELATTAGVTNWVWVSVDAFTRDVNRLGVPDLPSGALFQQRLTNMNVFSSNTNITTGTGFADGNIEFWPHNYGAANARAVTNASATYYDWGDQLNMVYGPAGHGSMQIHNAGASNVLFAYNAWGTVRTSEMGIGNYTGNATNTDWTLLANAGNYARRQLYVLVLPSAATNGPAPLRASSHNGLTNVLVTFDEPVSDASAAPANFVIDGGALAVAAATLEADYRSVRLTTAGQTPGATYTIAISNVFDRTTNQHEIAGGSTVGFTPLAGLGSVPEFTNYTMVYGLALPGAPPNYNTNGLTYDIDRRPLIDRPFNRVAYYMELATNAGPTNWVFVSCDAMTTNINQIGVPVYGVGRLFQQIVTNASVYSSNTNILSGTGIATCNMEFWPWNYTAATSTIPNGSSNRLDCSDTYNTGGQYGSMQIHNHAALINGVITGQTLFSFSRFGAGQNSDTCIGIGNSPTGEPDWTHVSNGRSYTTKTVYVFVQLTNAPPAPPPPETAPIFVTHPHSLTAPAGTATGLFAAATGTSPDYQWRLDGTPIAGATNYWLAFASIQAADAGSYDVIASNSAGVATSLVAILSVTGAPPASGYAAYAGQIPNPSDRGYQNDPDGDGFANLLEYVTGANPTNADIGARMGGARTNGALALTFHRSIAATDATLIVEGSYAATNGAEWTGIATNLGGSWGVAPHVAEAGGPDPVSVTVTDTAPPATNRFLRLRVTGP